MTIDAKRFFLLIYVIANLYAGILFLYKGELGGDFSLFPVENSLLLALCTVLVVFSYYFILGPYYSFFVRRFFKLNLKARELKYSKLLGVLVVILQLLFVTYVMLTGAYRAGSTVTVDGFIKYIWIFLPVDMIFLVYYSKFRSSKLSKYNIALYICSNLLRGWTSFVFILLFMELRWFFYVSKKTISLKMASFLFCMAMVLVPALISLKWAVRVAENVTIETIPLIIEDVLLIASRNVTDQGTFSYLTLLVSSISERLQHLSNVYMLAEHSDEFRAAYYSAQFLPYFAEGLPQLTLLSVFDVPYYDLHTFLPNYFYPLADAGTSFHTGFLSWAFISPYLSVVYFLYVTFLILFGVYLAKKLCGNMSLDLIWFSLMLYLMNGWFNAYINILIAFSVVITIEKFFSIVMTVNNFD